jgi:hypothetical protein
VVESSQAVHPLTEPFEIEASNGPMSTFYVCQAASMALQSTIICR